MKTIKKWGLSIFLVLLAFSLVTTLSNALSSSEAPEDNVSNITSAIYKMDLKEGYVTLKERDIIEFQWKGKSERIMVREISKDKESIAVTVFIGGANDPIYTFLGFKNHLNIDFDLDREPDLSVGLSDIYHQDVTLYLKPLTDEPTITKNTNNTGLIKGIFIAVGVIVLGLIAYLLIKKSKFKKKKR